MRNFILTEKKIISKIQKKIIITELPLVGNSNFSLALHSELKTKYKEKYYDKNSDEVLLDILSDELNHYKIISDQHKKDLKKYLKEAKTFDVEKLDDSVLIFVYPFKSKYYRNLFDLKFILNSRHVIFSDEIIEGGNLYGIIEKANNGKKIYIYSNCLDKSIYYNLNKKKKMQCEKYDIFKSGDLLEKMDIRTMDKDLYYFFLSKYMSKRVDYKVPGIGFYYGVYFGDKILGCIGLSQNIYGNKIDTNTRNVFLNSDFVLNNEKKYAKLIAMLVLSCEVQENVQKRVGMNFDGVITAVFSKNPESMKYRGVFKKIKSSETDDGFRLVYHASFEDQSAKEILEKWKKSYMK